MKAFSLMSIKRGVRSTARRPIKPQGRLMFSGGGVKPVSRSMSSSGRKMSSGRSSSSRAMLRKGTLD
jgi:hypothetical protein